MTLVLGFPLLLLIFWFAPDRICCMRMPSKLFYVNTSQVEVYAVSDVCGLDCSIRLSLWIFAAGFVC